MSGERRTAVVISSDAAVVAAVGASLEAAGLTVDQRDTPPLPGRIDATVIVVDRAAREAAGEALRTYGAPVIVVGDDLADDALVALMLDAPVSHAIADPADRGVEITGEKLASGDLFGLEKYLERDATVQQRGVTCDEERRHVTDEICAWAETAGARRTLVHRIRSTVDELLMNALHDTPFPPDGPSAVLRWAHDGGTLAVSVGDTCGAIVQRDIIDNVRRARASRGRPRDSSPAMPSGERVAGQGRVGVGVGEPVRARQQWQGAGLGLYLVMANVASLIVNVERGRRTEVVCLFDLRAGARQAIAAPRALHVFAQ